MNSVLRTGTYWIRSVRNLHVMWAVGKILIGPDQITPRDPIPYLLSFSEFQGLIQSSLIRYCSCHLICTFKRMLTLLFISSSLRLCHWNFKLPCNWTATKFFGFLHFPLFSNESNQGHAHNTPREVPGPWSLVTEVSIDPKFFMLWQASWESLITETHCFFNMTLIAFSAKTFFGL